MAATCTPLDPGEASQVSGPRDSPCTRFLLDFAKKHCWRCLSSVESSRVPFFPNFPIYQQEEGPQSLSWPVHGVSQPNPPLLDRVRRTPVTRE